MCFVGYHVVRFPFFSLLIFFYKNNNNVMLRWSNVVPFSLHARGLVVKMRREHCVLVYGNTTFPYRRLVKYCISLSLHLLEWEETIVALYCDVTDVVFTFSVIKMRREEGIWRHGRKPKDERPKAKAFGTKIFSCVNI